MLNKLWLTLKPPVYPEDDDKSRSALLLYVMLYFQSTAAFLICISLISTLYAHQRWSASILAFLFLFFAIGLITFAQHGHVRAASKIIFLSTYCSVTLLSAFNGYSFTFSAYLAFAFFLLICAGLLICWQFLVELGLFIILSNLIILYGQQIGLLPKIPFGYFPPGAWFTFAILLTESAFLLGLATYYLHATLHNAKKELIERRQVEATLRQQTEYLMSLHETALSLLNRQELIPLLKSILTRACQILNTKHGYLEMLNQDGSALKMEVGYGIFERFSGMVTYKGQAITGRVWESKQTLIIDDYAKWEFREHSLENIGLHAGLALPLISTGQVIGSIGMAYTELDYRFSPVQVELMQRFAALAALAIDNARLYQASKNELTERINAENALRKSEARLQAVIDHIPFDLWVCDAEGRYIIQNRAAENLSPVVGKTALEIEEVPLIIRQRWHEEHCIALSGEAYRNDSIVEMVNGEERHFIITVTPIRIDNAIIGLVGMSVDVTALWQAEAQVRKLNEELEDRVAKRTIQLKSAIQELESFSYSVSHDLRAPLRAINGFTKILMEDFSSGLEPEALRYLVRTQSNAIKMGILIDDLLQFSRISRQQIKHEVIDLTELVQTVFTELIDTVPSQRQIKFQVTTLPNILGDSSLIRQVFVNLLDNAIKYTRNCSITRINVSCQYQDDEEIIVINDNGAGFDMRYADKLFGVFQRLHREDEFEGTGVGLAIVNRIIQKHGGRIWADSKLKQGATFYFTIGKQP